MPHSSRKRTQIRRIERDLERRVKQLEHYRTKILAKAQIKTRDDVSLGDLRDKYRPTHYDLPPTTMARVKKFKRYRSRANKPLVIYGKDGGMLCCRIRMEDGQLAKDLFEEIEALPSVTKQHLSKGIVRGNNEIRHLGLWSPYSKVPFVTAEQRLDGEKATSFLKASGKIFKEMTDLLGAMAPNVFMDYQRYPIIGKDGRLERPCGAWSACVVNRGWDDPEAGNVHRDVKESQYGYSCIVCCGDYTGGDLILWDLGIKIELRPGDLFLFPDSLIHHSIEAAKGTRHSVVVFTQENMFDYWHRDFGMNLKRHQKKEKKKSRKGIGKRRKKN
jgi:hypothetical protein